MEHYEFRPLCTWLAALACLGSAQAADGDKQFGEMVVKGEKSPLPANLPAVTEGMNAQQIEETVNAVTAAETVKYLPSIAVRERFVGDRNAIVATRTTGTLSSAQSLLYADNLMLSNLLGNSFAYPPRWGLVGPDEIARVDVVYGPFSALYPGNSMGGVILLTTRMPEKFEAHAGAQTFATNYKLYGTDQHNTGKHLSGALGNRNGAWSWWASADHLDAHGHPMSFATAATGGAGTTAVTGAYVDRDANGATRIVTGGYGIDHTIQDNAKIKLAYDFTPFVRATYTLGVWQNRSETTVQTYLRDAAGNPIYNNANLSIGGVAYKVSGMNPGYSESEHLMHGLGLKTTTGGEWDLDAVFSLYEFRKDSSRAATNYGVDNTGKNTFATGTGWQNFDLKADWRPGGDHQVSLGYHYDRYVLSSYTYDTADWRNGASTTLNTSSVGRTETHALFAQDAMRLAPEWTLTLGGRYEVWHAFDGANYDKSLAVKSMSYAERRNRLVSPKASLAYQVADDWQLRGSWGKAYRFPTVAELFQTTKTTVTTLQNDPNLKPEQVSATDLTLEGTVGEHFLRFSYFHEDKRDALFSQTNTTVTPNVTSIQNIERIRTDGAQFAGQLKDVGTRGLDLSGSVTYARSKVLKDDKCPTCVNGNQVRVPDWRATLVGTYRQSDALSYTLAARYSGRQYGSLPNADINPNTYGGNSSYLIVDAKLLYKFDKQWSATVGIDNLNNYKAYAFHPYPQRTVLAKLKYDY